MIKAMWNEVSDLSCIADVHVTCSTTRGCRVFCFGIICAGVACLTPSCFKVPSPSVGT